MDGLLPAMAPASERRLLRRCSHGVHHQPAKPCPDHVRRIFCALVKVILEQTLHNAAALSTSVAGEETDFFFVVRQQRCSGKHCSTLRDILRPLQACRPPRAIMENMS